MDLYLGMMRCTDHDESEVEQEVGAGRRVPQHVLDVLHPRGEVLAGNRDGVRRDL